MQMGTRARALLGHVLVAVAYAIGFALLRQISFSHWLVFAGLRLAALLLVPYRYWPALAIGEMGPLAYTGITWLDQFGWLWSMLIMVPPIGLAMPVVYWCRERLHVLPSKSAINMGALLLCTLLVSVIWTVSNMGILAAAQLPPGYPPLQYGVLAARWMLGNYLGVLTLTPLILLLREDLLATPLREFAKRISDSRLALESLSLLLPALALLTWFGSGASGNVRQAAQMAMFLPVVWLALRHGWRGAAIGGTAASIAIVLMMPARYDDDTLRAQVFVAFTITTMLLLGARIAALNQREQQERADFRLTLALAQRNVHMGEMQLRKASEALEQIRATVHSVYQHRPGHSRQLLPDSDERSYQRQAAGTQEQLYRLADSLYPLAWEERGLPAALREGSMARVLDETGLLYRCDIRGGALGQLSPAVQMTLYRLAFEAIVCACADRDITDIGVRLRSGAFGGRLWAVLCVDSRASQQRVGRVRWDELVPRLAKASTGMGLEAMRDRAEIFEGRVRARALPQLSRISIMLFEPQNA